MNAPAPYLTDREQRSHDADNGHAAATAIAHQLMAGECRNLPENLIAASIEQFFFAVAGTIAERHATVDAWAARHHVTAGWDDALRYYCARVRLGTSSMICIASPVSEPASPDSPQPAGAAA